MTMPKKGMRKITVGGDVYRYAIRQDGSTHMMITAELDVPESGQVMQTRIQVLLGTGVTPEWVADAIVKATEQGWKPKEKGAKFTGQLILFT